jgi:ppGpp synthetase/RelA/SpoT-type nucleotidyltranferase
MMSMQRLFASGKKNTIKVPWESKSRVDKAGDAVRASQATPQDLAIIDSWREAHRHVLNTFQAILRTRTRSSKIVVAQRHKRKRTIFGKLQRYKTMSLSRMDDVAGCRLIFPDIRSMHRFRATLHKANFKHRIRNDADKWDYIKKPKLTGYRGIHDVYEYDANSEHGKPYKGLLIELQYRTAAQHAWATCVEVVGLITESQPKFQEGDKRFEKILAIASEMIARAIENSYSCFPELSDHELIQSFFDLDKEINLMKLLRGLNTANSEVTNKKNVILIFSQDESLEVRTYRDSTEAIKSLFALERENPAKDIVLVRADTSNEVRIAFRNYFSDATEFVRLIDRSCEKLGGVRIQTHKGFTPDTAPSPHASHPENPLHSESPALAPRSQRSPE